MTPKTSPTIYDVAKYAGVSITTVSRVLNASDKVNDATRTKVIHAIDHLGFIPKAEARARALRSAGRIGVLSPFFTSPSFVQRLRGISSALSDTNHELIIYSVETTDHLQGYLSSLSLTGNLDGLIILSMEIDEASVKRLHDHQLKTVLVEYPVEKLSCVVINDINGGRLAGEHLINKGHKRLAFIGVDRSPEYAHKPIGLRLRGFQAALDDAGIELPNRFVIQAPFEMERTFQLAVNLLQAENPPTAVFAATDFQAMAILKAARSLGLKTPDDIAVIGFDDLDIASYIGLSTITQHLDESGRIAVELLLADLTNPERLPRQVELPLEVVARDTT